ncbi:helix-hairpin-helix domain-containing protein [Simkania negevensis]|uniref:helix-hairpin-helix domain-containing protein n=1 Tax=Simkania negevensis TaxID=83561 RepID=UPI00059E219B|nr:helix-hairpin-helix domain-containing protein [Simkania negevensis]
MQQIAKQLKDLQNVGKATLKDLEVLGIDTIELLAEQDPTFLFQELERRTQKQHDPCVWDVFAAIIHEAKTGTPTKWWEWTVKRKALDSPLHAEGNSD